MLASFRMYDAVPRAAAAWREMFARVFDEARAQIDIVEHRWPKPIAALWAEPELGCAFMCGWPFARSRRMQAIAAPVPSPRRYGGVPRYCSEFLVHEASGFRSLEDTFGHRFGWMSQDSHSGFNAPRAWLSQFVTPTRRSLFSESRGPLGAPANALDALRGGDVDVIALDSYWLDLVRHHEPSRLSQLRCVGVTPWMPIPLLVASPQADARVVESLRERLCRMHEQVDYAPLLRDVLLDRFVEPDVDAYRSLEKVARYARSRDYESIR